MKKGTIFGRTGKLNRKDNIFGDNYTKANMISFFSLKKGRLEICEDSLTATVFDLLKYLPAEISWNILKKSLYLDKLPDYSGELLEVLFWEKWNSKDTNNSRFVEPDLFLRYKNFDVIIEAKRRDEYQQKNPQLIAQIKSYQNEYVDDNKPLFYIQLGGLNDKRDIANKLVREKSIVICKTDWSKFLHQIVNEKNKLENIEITTITPYKRILDDMIKGFELHQYFRKTWLENITMRNNVNSQQVNSFLNYGK